MPESEDQQQRESSKADSRRSGLPDLSADEDIEALADRMVDVLTGGPTPSPETASAEVQTAKPRVIEVDGDRGEDIDDCLENLFGGEPPLATPVTPPVEPAPPAGCSTDSTAQQF